MRKYLSTLTAICLGTLLSFAQTNESLPISGIVIDSSSGEPIASATVRIKDSRSGTTTDQLGRFRLSVTPLNSVIVITHTSYDAVEVRVDGPSELKIFLAPSSAMLYGVILKSKGLSTTVIDAPFSAEIITQKQISQLPGTPYQAIAFKKGFYTTSSSLTFHTPSTRGFNGSGSTRVNQLIDGMDNQAPGLNFFVGNFVGPTDLDIESIELLPGASSALYGPGGMNGTIFINSKNPFKYEGLSLQIKEGVMHVDKRQRANVSPYHDFSFRWAKNFKDKFAFKIGARFRFTSTFNCPTLTV